MNAGKTVFAQILEHLPRYEFDKFVEKYEGNHRVRRFPCETFAQLHKTSNYVIPAKAGIQYYQAFPRFRPSPE